VTPARDKDDRIQALIAWAGVFCGGPIIPVVILVMNWTKPQSLARRQALLASIMMGVIFLIYVPFVGRMAVQGGPDTAFWIVWVGVVTVTLVVTIVQVVRVARTPIAGPA